MKKIVLIFIALTFLTGCSVDDAEYFGSGSLSVNPINLNLFANTQNYFLSDYNLKNVDNKDKKVIQEYYDEGPSYENSVESSLDKEVVNNITNISSD